MPAIRSSGQTAGPQTYVGQPLVRAALAIVMVSFAVALLRAEDANLAADFKHPPPALKSWPLWHLNGKLTTAELASQLKAARDQSGFGGVAVLPVSETQPKYLTEEYFSRYGDLLATCKEMGLKVVFYDDINFPSGTAGGALAEKFPDAIACRLDNLETNITGPAAWTQPLPKGIFMGAVAMNQQTLERRDISASAVGDRLAWQAPAGAWKLMVFTCVRTGKGLDYLCPESIDKFFSLTYDEYYKRFAAYFGSTIYMTYFDDVGLRGAERRIWTPDYNKKFKLKNGFSPVVDYPALWHDIGPDTAAARVALFDFRAELFAEGYPGKVHTWAAAHGILSSGHAMGQYEPQPAFLAGDAIKFYRHSDIPMIDSIHYYGHGRPGFKLTSSASSSFDRPLTVVEIYGNFHQFDAPMLFRNGMELFARGANFFLPHAMWYDPAKVRIPPLISHFDAKIGPALPEYNNWVGRASLLLQGGRHVADIGVLYPVAAMEAFARLDAVVDQPKVKNSVHPGHYVPPRTDLNELSDLLTGVIRRDFTFLHPEILNDRCIIQGATLHLNNLTNFEDYRVFILPAEDVIYWSNLQKIKQFYDAGGKVIATTELPGKAAEFGHDQDVVATVRSLFGPGLGPSAEFTKQTNAAGGAAYFVPSLSGAAPALAAALEDAQADADVRFAGQGSEVKPDQSMLSYLHKVKAGRNIYFFANSTDQRVETGVTLRGRITLQNWNPHTGDLAPLTTTETMQNGQPFTQARLCLEPVKSVFWVERAAGESLDCKDKPK